MTCQKDDKRIAFIYKMLLAWTKGKFSYRIPKTGKNDKTEAIINLLNLLTEEIKHSFYYHIYTAGQAKFRPRLMWGFILNLDNQIKATIGKPPTVLSTKLNNLRPTAYFNDLLTNKSKVIWRKTLSRLQKNKNDTSVHQELSFKTKNKLTYTVDSTINLIKNTHTGKQQLIVFNIDICAMPLHAYSVSTNKSNFLSLPHTSKRIIDKHTDIKALHLIHQHLKENLNSPFPSLKKLTKDYGINEFKLKIGFKQFFNTTVSKFHQEQRLNKAHQLIRFTHLSIQEIAFDTGFNSISHFSKSFKKQFGYNSSQLRNRFK